MVRHVAVYKMGLGTFLLPLTHQDAITFPALDRSPSWRRATEPTVRRRSGCRDTLFTFPPPPPVFV